MSFDAVEEDTRVFVPPLLLTSELRKLDFAQVKLLALSLAGPKVKLTCLPKAKQSSQINCH